jgi:hypothetical protein
VFINLREFLFFTPGAYANGHREQQRLTGQRQPIIESVETL